MKPQLIGMLICGKFDAEISAKYGNYSDLISMFIQKSDVQFAYRTYLIQQGELPARVDECAGYIISGSRHSSYEQIDWIIRLQQFIRQCASAKHPVVGICFGHQIIAQALGGKVAQSDKGWGLGIHTYHSYLANGYNFKLSAIHQDQVLQPPKSAQVIAGSEFCQNGVLLYPGFGFSIQLHPEFTQGFLLDLLTAGQQRLATAGNLPATLVSLRHKKADTIKKTANLCSNFFTDARFTKASLETGLFSA